MSGERSAEPAILGNELESYLRRPGLARLLAAVRERRERLGRIGGRIRLAGGDAEERQAVADLFGLAILPKDPLWIDLARLDRALRESRFGIGLDDALTALGHPLRDLSGERAESRRSWEALWARAAESPAVRRHPRLERWLDELRRGGILRRLAGRGDPERFLAGALAVLDDLESQRR